jgi:DNA-directed RNA polymerase subunit RPC12/RpoP
MPVGVIAQIKADYRVVTAFCEPPVQNVEHEDAATSLLHTWLGAPSQFRVVLPVRRAENRLLAMQMASDLAAAAGVSWNSAEDLMRTLYAVHRQHKSDVLSQARRLAEEASVAQVYRLELVSKLQRMSLCTPPVLMQKRNGTEWRTLTVTRCRQNNHCPYCRVRRFMEVRTETRNHHNLVGVPVHVRTLVQTQEEVGDVMCRLGMLVRNISRPDRHEGGYVTYTNLAPVTHRGSLHISVNVEMLVHGSVTKLTRKVRAATAPFDANVSIDEQIPLGDWFKCLPDWSPSTCLLSDNPYPDHLVRRLVLLPQYRRWYYGGIFRGRSSQETHR